MRVVGRFGQLVGLALPALAVMLEEADAALGSADMKVFRKRLETVIARLGHLR